MMFLNVGFMFEPTNDAIAKSQITRDHIRLALARNLNVLSANTVTVIASTEAKVSRIMTNNFNFILILPKRDKHPQMLLDVDASEGEDPMFPQIPVQAHAAQAQLAQLWGFPISAMHNSASRVSIHLGVQREITTMSIDRIKATTRLLEQKMKKEEDPRQRAKNYGNLSRFVRRLHHLIP